MTNTHKMLINAAHEDELRVAIIKNNRLIDLDIEHPGNHQKKSNIYKGKITSIERSLGAVFVDYGSDRHGFLPLKDIARDFFWNQKDIELKDVDINKALKLNQEILVQVEKEERGNKGAALTTYISLAGSYLVLMPTNPKGGGISRRIEGESREELRDIISQLIIPEGMSVIIRTAGVGKNLEELQWDLDLLLKYWDAIFQAAADKTDMIYLIHQESDIVIRSIRDHLRQSIDEIIIDDKTTFERVRTYIEKINPEIVNKLVHYDNALPLFSAYQIEHQIEQAVQGEVKLPSGGSIVIDHTEALVTIDINSARATKGSSIEETAFNTNLEAAREIPRQLRIRDIGGLVVIDFIDMLSNSNQRKIEDELRNALKFDRARVQIGKISRFGLMEMSRQRLSSSLSKNTQVTCPRCKGRGCIRSIESTSLAILRSLAEHSVKAGGAQIQLQLPLDVATFLLNEHRDEFNKIQAQENNNIILIPNQYMVSPQFEIKIGKQEGSNKMASYKKVKTPKPSINTRQNNKDVKTEQPAINQYLSNNLYAPRPKAKNNETSLIKRIKDAIFGVSEDTKDKPEENHTQAKRKPRAQQTRRGNYNRNRDTKQQDKDGNRRDERRSQPTRNQTSNKADNEQKNRPRHSQQTKPEENRSNSNRRNNSTQNRGQSNNRNQTSETNNTRRKPKENTQANADNKPSTQKNKQTTARRASGNQKPVQTTTSRIQTPKAHNPATIKDEQAQVPAVKPTVTNKPAATAKASEAKIAPSKAPTIKADNSQPIESTINEKTESKKPKTGTSAADYIAQRKKNKNRSLQQVKTSKSDAVNVAEESDNS